MLSKQPSQRSGLRLLQGKGALSGVVGKTLVALSEEKAARIAGARPEVNFFAHDPYGYTKRFETADSKFALLSSTLQPPDLEGWIWVGLFKEYTVPADCLRWTGDAGKTGASVQVGRLVSEAPPLITSRPVFVRADPRTKTGATETVGLLPTGTVVKNLEKVWTSKQLPSGGGDYHFWAHVKVISYPTITP